MNLNGFSGSCTMNPLSAMVVIHGHMGRAAEPDDFPEAEMTPDFPYYANDDEDGFTGNPYEIEDVEIPTPEKMTMWVFPLSCHLEMI